jgi:hypothetical protein
METTTPETRLLDALANEMQAALSMGGADGQYMTADWLKTRIRRIHRVLEKRAAPDLLEALAATTVALQNWARHLRVKASQTKLGEIEEMILYNAKEINAANIAAIAKATGK